MKDAVLIQWASDAEYAMPVGLYYDRHIEYCHQHNLDYWMLTGPLRFEEHIAWNKLLLASQAFTLGYELVVWLDTDSYIYDTNVDVREACITAFNMVRWHIPLKHLQAGVIFMNNGNGYAKAICDRLLAEQKYYLEVFPDLHGWFEQGQINQISKLGPNIRHFTDLAPRWNWCERFCKPCTDVVIKSWHGIVEPERTALMRKEFGK
jgi:hypothetical protein